MKLRPATSLTPNWASVNTSLIDRDLVQRCRPVGERGEEAATGKSTAEGGAVVLPGAFVSEVQSSSQPNADSSGASLSISLSVHLSVCMFCIQAASKFVCSSVHPRMCQFACLAICSSVGSCSSFLKETVVFKSHLDGTLHRSILGHQTAAAGGG